MSGIQLAAAVLALAILLAWAAELHIRAAQAEDHAAALRQRLRAMRARTVRRYAMHQRERLRRRQLEAEIVAGRVLTEVEGEG